MDKKANHDEVACEKQAEPEFDRHMLQMLVCPVSQSPLALDREASELISEKSMLAYPIRSGVPIMLPSEARALSEAERAKIKSRR